MTKQEKWLVDSALAYLYGNDASPEVGMGMFPATAVDLAIQDLRTIATVLETEPPTKFDKEVVLREVVNRRKDRFSYAQH